MLSEDYRINFHLFDRDELNIFRRTILTWYDDNRRQLPWRRPLVSTSSVNSYQDKSIVEPIKTKNSVEHAYAVWISEVMCQQTQVATVINYYTRWIEKFPTLEALAVSSVEDVNKVWSGLGYYARARRLREAAIKIMKDFDGKLPESSEELRTLPGIGLYTANAIASIAFNKSVGVVDGNVMRVLARMRLIGADIKVQAVISLFWRLANEAVDPDRPGDFNQALMELGAVLCTPQNPNCAACPVQLLCKARKTVEFNLKNKGNKPPHGGGECLYCGDMKMPCHDVSAFPFKSRKKALREESFVVCVISVRSGEQPDKTYLIRRRPAKGLLAGLWEFPSVQVNSKACQSRSARRRLLAEFLKGANKEVYDILQKKSFQKSKGYIEHLFSHIRATYFVEYCECQGVTSLTIDCWKWVTESGLKIEALSTAMRKVFTKATEDDQKYKQTLLEF